MSKFYTGVGSRKAPQHILQLMEQIAQKLARKDLTLRSGGAKGADLAFEHGCDLATGKKEIFYAKDATLAARQMLNDILTPSHIQALTRGGWLDLHARNCMQVLGRTLNMPAEVLICWTPDGATSATECSRTTGGTGTAIKLASKHNIRVCNLQRPMELQKWQKWLR